MSVLNNDPTCQPTTVFDYFKVRTYMHNFYGVNVNSYFHSTGKLPAKPNKSNKVLFRNYIHDILREIHMGRPDDEKWTRRLMDAMNEFCHNAWGKGCILEQIIETWPLDFERTYISAYTIKGWFGGQNKSIKLKFTPNECAE